MAISESSFRDRQAKAQLLHDFIAGFTPFFVPADLSLTPVNFQGTIDTINSANGIVETLAGNYTTSSTQRVFLVKTVRASVTQALSYVKSNKAWVTQFKAAKMAADKLRGVRTPTVTTPPVDPGDGSTPPAEVAKRNKGQQAYAELVAHLQSFVNAVTSCSGYAPTSVEIGLAKFNEHLSVFKSLNLAISTLDSQLTTERSKRSLLYFSETGLQVKFHSVKDAVKGQYGQSSSQYASVKVIRW